MIGITSMKLAEKTHLIRSQSRLRSVLLLTVLFRFSRWPLIVSNVSSSRHRPRSLEPARSYPRIFPADGTISAAPLITDARCEHVSATSQDGRVWWPTSAEVPPTRPKFRSYGRFWHERRHEHPEVRLSLTATLPQNGGVVPAGGKMELLLARKLGTPTSSS